MAGIEMADLSLSIQEILSTIYIGQHVNPAGILQSEVDCKDCLSELTSNALIRENQWYRFRLFQTTNSGAELAKAFVNKRIENVQDQIRNEFKGIPPRVLGFFVNRFIPRKLVFKTEKPLFSETWEDRLLTDGKVWTLWSKFFGAIESFHIALRAHDYVSTRGGELRDLYYVISPELQEYLIKNYSLSDFTPAQEETLTPYPVLTSVSKILNSDNIDFLRQKYYELLKLNSVTEGQIAGIINRMNQKGIASEYRGLLSEKKPFDVIDSTRFQYYLEQNLIEPAIDVLLEKGGLIKQYSADARIPTLLEVKIERGFLDSSELGEFYILVSALERDLREFIKSKMGKGWEKRVESELPAVFKRWQEKMKKDENWGIDAERDLINYADVEDYIAMITKFNRIFVSADRQLSNVVTYLEIWYKYGRNPLMHSRTVTRQKYETTKSAIDFIRRWMTEKTPA